MLRKFKRGEIYYIRGTVQGKYVYESTRCRGRQDAEDYLVRRQTEISKDCSDQRLTFPEAASLYMKAGKDPRFLAPLIRHFKDSYCNNIVQSDIINAIQILYPRASNATKNRQVFTPVSAVINNAAISNKCNRVKFEKLTVEEAERPHATPEYLSKFMDYAPDNLAAICLFMAKTGARVGSATALDWDDVNLQKSRAVLRNTKNGDTHYAYLPVEVVALLANMENKTGKVFGYACRQSLYDVMKRTAKKADLPYLTPHEIGRHTFATWYMEFVEPNLKKLMEAGGWKSVQSVIRYVHVVPSEAKTAVEKMPEIGAKRVQSSVK